MLGIWPRRRQLPRNSQARGDTIVEVMVVLAVLGLAISISYATANRSLLNARQAQENSQATELVQAQLENLRALSAGQVTLDNGNPNPNYIYQVGFDTTHPFCIDSSGNIQTTPCVDGFYTIGITYAPAGGSVTGGTFTVNASWPDVLGQGTDGVTMNYKLYLVESL